MNPCVKTRIALFGPPGAGKGSQAELLVERCGFRHISTGIILRAAIRNFTRTGREARKYMDAGRLAPDGVVRDLAESAIAEAGFDRFVLDGYPRTLQQARWLRAFLSETPLSAVIFLTLSEDNIIDRLSKRRVHKETRENYHLDHKPPPDMDPGLIIQRPDDQPDAIRERLRVYQEQTKPVEAYYRGVDLLYEVDALGSFEEVYARIDLLLKKEAR